eukprot:gnl/TRDRNA2_/TRDRNA2_144931_c1_seq1.p1 gnl/TRDRNA2_/TRDRNA2_144931_c1~~gnl/TRDRNA2_/TRDRNA2_144931_c1_seq1.p1  ORF type:complete len:210 (+),score=32.46 gnl/TRDRNA2_/TRDRNA2_144931_c1_seq1:58-687(+)
MEVRGDLGMFHHQIISKMLNDMASEKSGAMVRMVEVGVNTGPFAEALLDAVPNLNWLGVDPYDPGGAYSGGNLADNSFRYTKAVMRIMRFGSRASIMRMFSSEAASWIQDGSLDLVWIDGDHTYDGAYADLVSFAPKMRPGGIIAGHDYGLAFTGVIWAAHDFFPQCPAVDGLLQSAPDHMFFWKVPPGGCKKENFRPRGTHPPDLVFS